ncbi:WD40 repeat domain 85 [Cryptococcus neoformans Bt85]|nr:WD40 repeat domain 85 [Cryptococcus neoformans var. grubii Bt85]
MSLSRAKSLANVDTLYSADSIEFCPFEGFQDLLVCGTYQIVEPENGGRTVDADVSDDEQAPKQTQRVGRLLLFQVGHGHHLQELQKIETSAILDIKWSPNPAGGPQLAVADAKGHITVFGLDVEIKRLREMQRLDVADETKLCLSLDFSNRRNLMAPSEIITSVSNGSLAHLIPASSGYVLSSSWPAHDFEPWITTFSIDDPKTVWSGGDDCKLKRWDLREPGRPTFVNKNFEAGVTTITPSPHTPNLLAVGSYDENLRFFDARSAMEPLLTIPMGGGIWRTRFHPHAERAGDLLVACMHDGFKIVHVSQGMAGGDWESDYNVNGSVVKIFEEHSSLAYGADWSRLPMEEGESLVGTCSFYDHTMHLWQG